MQHKTIIHTVLSTLFLLITASTYASSISTLNIINHYPGVLMFSVERNGEVVPDLQPTVFYLAENQSKQTVVASHLGDLEAYIDTEGHDESHKQIFAFWGVDSVTGVRGYLDKGIAYSWDDHDKSTIIFCHPKDFPCMNNAKSK